MFFFFRNFQVVTETVPIAPFIIGVTFAFSFYVGCISFVRPVHFKILLPSFLIIFLLTDTLHFPFHCHGLGCPVYCSGWFCRILLLLLLWHYFGEESEITFRRRLRPSVWVKGPRELRCRAGPVT